MEHAHGDAHIPSAVARTSLNGLAFSATIHCLTGCAIGEVLGMVLGTALNWHNGATIAVSTVLAFLFGYAFTLAPLLKHGVDGGTSVRLALASDTVSIAVMEIVDNGIILHIPGAMAARLSDFVLGVVSCFPSSSRSCAPIRSIDR
jgi:uncharacterized membrane protein